MEPSKKLFISSTLFKLAENKCFRNPSKTQVLPPAVCMDTTQD